MQQPQNLNPTAAEHATESGMALLAVLVALTLMMLLALPFSVSMTVGADAAQREVEQAAVQFDSASVRELLVADAAMSHPAVDPTPTFDGLDEFPSEVILPPAFRGLGQASGDAPPPSGDSPLLDPPQVLLGGEVVDLQRFLALDSASPLMFANVLGLTTRLREDLVPDADSLVLEDADALPDSGVLWVSEGAVNEVIRYGNKQGNTLRDLSRAQLTDQLFSDGKQPLRAGSLVLDYRCVIAAAWPFVGNPEAGRQTRRAYRAVGEVAEVERAGFGGFTTDELDKLQRVFSVDTMASTAATWGRPERVFNELIPGKNKTMVVKSALHLGAGSSVRLRNLRTGAVEYGLVMATATQNGGVPELQFPQVFLLQLLLPPLQLFPATDTVVEPLVPAPVNVNTASQEVLAAVCTEVRIGNVKIHEADGRRRASPRSIRAAEAQQFASGLVDMRGGSEPQAGAGPFTGWRDLVQRAFKPRFEGGANDAEKQPWMWLFRNLQTGRDCGLEMGTAPICFQSGPWVKYRAAASRSRSALAAGVVGREERTGIAAAMPGFKIERRWATQEVLEECFLLDRRAPYWVTTPVNLGHLVPGDGNDPAPRYFPYVVPVAYPGIGLGEPRYPVTDDADSGITPAPSTAVNSVWKGQSAPRASETFAQALDVRGHDVKKQGPYTMVNTGPRGGAGGGATPPAQSGGGRNHQLTFPFSNSEGFVDRFATSFWLEPQSLDSVVLFDHGDGDPDRNRLSIQGRDGSLVFEVIDEAGLDPQPSDSPSGVKRTATEWTLPLAELNLPANTAVHLSASAYSGRPADLSFAVDGMTRGKPKYVTYLTAPLKPFDPSLANNQTPPGTRGNDSYVDLQVESTEGFPPVGVLRIGLELFEYTGISGNTFQCQWKDSMGGRGARQVGREFRPDVPVDANGEPTVDIEKLQQQGANLDVFPEHPAGSMVELYGYSAVLSEDTIMRGGATRLDGAIGGFAVARGFLPNGRPITISLPGGGSFPLGTGLDEPWTGDLELADPVPSGRDLPKAAQAEITDAFATTGGYALLVQIGRDLTVTVGNTTQKTSIGGVEPIRYTSRDGNKLKGVQRAQQLPGQDGQISSDEYDGKARKFVTKWSDNLVLAGTQPPVPIYDLPNWILWVVPISVSVQNTSTLWDPQDTGLSEWVQLYPQGGDPNDTEWVRYDTIAQNKYLCRANRAAWEATRFQLTRSSRREDFDVNGGTAGNNPTAPPWGTVTPTAGYIGYTPKLEGLFPQIRAARYALRHRGDPMSDFFGGRGAGAAHPQATSSHPQSNALVTAVHRLQLAWGNYGALTGRVGRHDRIALVQGSAASGSARPGVEWHTANWSARRFNSDNLAQNQTPPERLGPWPFQLVAFRDAVGLPMIGPPPNTAITEPRKYDRLVKFPSGELPAAWCESPTIGAGIGNQQPMTGLVDEVEVVGQLARDVILDEVMTDRAQAFVVNRAVSVNPAGPEFIAGDWTTAIPKSGGLVAIDNEILAFQAHADGTFTVAVNGRGLLNTEVRGHDRGARVRFLTHRPAAILTANVGTRDAELPVQDQSALPLRGGTVLLGQELLHYAWTRKKGDQASLEMPRHFPPDVDPTSGQARGLFRGRYGTTPQGGVTGEAVIGFPFRFWDRYVERCDDPELAYFQVTTNEAPVFFRTLRWRQETVDPRVEVVCQVRADGKLSWADAPLPAGGLWDLRGSTEASTPHRLAHGASRLEIRFATAYKPGCVDLVGFRQHGWKTTARVEDVRVEYEGQGRIFDEQVTAR